MIETPAATITALRAENDRLSNLWQIEHDHATTLRAQIDRERAATIEAAAEVIDTCNAEGPYQAIGAASRIRALHTDATRAAMDVIRREGYEAGVREAARLCAMVDQPTEPWNAHDAMIFHIGFTAGRKGCEMAIAASIPPDPNTTPRE